jgi:trehalose 6-phosphate synthase
MLTHNAPISLPDPRPLGIVTRRGLVAHQNAVNGLSRLIVALPLDARTVWFNVDEGDDTNPAARATFWRFYHRLCNGYIWPLIHAMEPLIKPEQADLAAYGEVNERLAETISASTSGPGGMAAVWVHDFHFLPLAKYLRKRAVDLRAGMFHHAPVPDADVVGRHPELFRLYRDLFAYDYVGVQTPADLERLRSLARLADIELVPDRVGRHPVAPGAIEPHDCADHEGAGREDDQAGGADRFRFTTAGRADPIKGHGRVIEAFRRFAADHPASGAELLVLAAPSRAGSPGYGGVAERLRAQVAAVNALLPEAPIHLNTTELGQTTFDCHLANTDCLVLLPDRDGMNLIAKEYVLLRGPDRPGMLVLTRDVGARWELDGAIVVDGPDPQDHARALMTAARAPARERTARWSRLYAAAAASDARSWAHTYLRALWAAPLHA